MNLLPIEMREVQDKQRAERVDLIVKYQEKLKFSAISLLFFLALTVYTLLVPVLGIVGPIVFGAVALVFIQQTIRSNNYRKMHVNSYNFMESAYQIVQDNLKVKED